MPTIDSHCHVSPLWYEPVETLLYQMDRNGVDGAVLIQLLGQTDNAYQQDCLRRYPGRFASVVLVDHTRPDAVEQLRRLADDGASGVRLRPAMRSPGSDPLAIWRAAAELGLAVSSPGGPADFTAPSFAELLAELPTLQVVVEHFGVGNRPDADDAERAARLSVLSLARFPNVSMKIHGLGEIARRAMPPNGSSPFEQPIPPYLAQALEAFGAQRLMWGSDFPPVAAREGYANALELCRAQFASAEDQAWIFGGTAATIFKLG